VEIANNGAEGFTQYYTAANAGEWFDVVLMDIQMPVMDGLTSTELIRKFESEVGSLFALLLYLF
jgi:CheY-like chemotaxis protein